MARRNTHNYAPFIGEDASANFDNKSNPTQILGQDNVGITVQWTGATLTGQLKVYASNEVDANPAAGIPVTKWFELDMGEAILIDNTIPDVLININFQPWKWLAVEWTYTSGTGQMTIEIATKQVGG